MTTQKIKTLGTLTSKQKHNFREVDVPNADEELFHLNDEFVTYKDENGEPMRYVDAWKDRMQGISTRKNSVLAIEVVTTFSREEHIDLEKWKEENKKWLEKTFNVAPDGKQNVLSVIYHADEPGNVHCHAIVVPVDERNRLNASRFLDGRKALSEMQTSYAKSMEAFGLERGLQNGQAKHRDIKKYYADLNNAIKVPMPQKGETAMDYYNRTLENFQTLQAAGLRDREEKERKLKRKYAEQRVYQDKKYKEMKEEIDRKKEEEVKKAKAENKELYEEINKNKTFIEKQESTIQKMNRTREQLSNQLEKLQSVINNLEIQKEKAEKYDELQSKINLAKLTNPKLAKKISNDLKEIDELGYHISR